MSGAWADKWKKAGAATAAAVERVAVVAERVGVVEPKPKAANREAQRELDRRAEINARGAALRAERDAAFGRLLDGGRRWIESRPNWLARRGRA